VDSRIPIGIAAGLAPVRGRGDRLNIRRFALSSGQTNGIRLLEVLETRGRLIQICLSPAGFFWR
jgi:hypothetical protein